MKCETKVTIVLFVFMLVSELGQSQEINCAQIACTKKYDPVCGSDGVTYSNGCILQLRNCNRTCAEQVDVDRIGACDGPYNAESQPQQGDSRRIKCERGVCTAIYKPVCGTDGVTYSSKCALGFKNCRKNPDCYIKVAYKGKCRTPVCESTRCTLLYDPICGSDGVTYGNGCNLQVENCNRSCRNQVKIVQKGECGTSPSLVEQKTKPAANQNPNCENTVCLTNYDPVCATDGETYSNECYLGLENCRQNPDCYIKVAYKGKCRSTICENTACPRIYDPVCGSDGRTYSNGCVLQVENCNRSCENQVKIVHKGECGTTPSPVEGKTDARTNQNPNCEDNVCLDNYDPVCGTDGKTYSNECYLGLENCRQNPDCHIKVAYKGECRSTVCDNRVCTKIYDPICGSDGKTYDNGCVLQVENCNRSCENQVKIVQKGECGTTPSPVELKAEPATNQNPSCEDTVCLTIYDPVCGTDGKTYSNECYLGLENCRQNPDCHIKVAYKGECRSTVCDNRVCTKIYDPICGSDGKTYDNGCVLQVENYNRSCENQVKIVQKGECGTTPSPVELKAKPATNQNPSCEDTVCLTIYDPVCGTDGKTYSNECYLGLENCRQNPDCHIKVAYKGECRSTVCDNRVCTKIYDPICGSDGKTYDNGCVLQVENCNRSCENQVKIVQKGECGTTPSPVELKAKPATNQNPSCEDTVCLTIYDPVCGTDGKTYSNECYLGLENCRQNPDCHIKVAYKGECRSTVCDNRVCTKIYDPICGSDGKTYDNGCVLQVENCNRSCENQVKIVQKGECGTTPSPVELKAKPLINQNSNCEDNVCLAIYDPVCGTDGKTYSNECYLEFENCRQNPDCYIKVAYKGECRSTVCENTACPRIHKPICGSDGFTYSNGCFLQIENCKRSCDNQTEIVQRGECETTEPPKLQTVIGGRPTVDCEDTLCLAIYQPVCGTDGKTYGNACSLQQKNCRKNPDCYIKVAYEGECRSTVCENKGCFLIYDPICGSDGETYSNGCVLQVENCNRSCENQVKIVHKGECGTTPSPTAESKTEIGASQNQNCEDIVCLALHDPVCGTDGKTYSNECYLGLENCRQNPNCYIKVAYKGECRSTICEHRGCLKYYDPICGSDGNTYSNGCFLEVENCNRSCDNQIDIVHKGQCGTTPSPREQKTDAGASQTTNCEDTLCLAIYKPVCGTDGVTYGNECALRQKNCRKNPDCYIKVAHEGDCRSTICESKVCPEYYDPICASDDSTYDNGCFLELENCNISCEHQIDIVHKGKCGTTPSPEEHTTDARISQTKNCEDKICPTIYKPVCGTDGKTYSNECALRQKNCRKNSDCYIKVANEGKCRPTSCDELVCPEYYDPFCGSDGSTYDNGCFIERENCKRSCDKQIDILQRGECRTTPFSRGHKAEERTSRRMSCEELPCLANYDPLCGSDGVTYSNQCALDEKNCRKNPDCYITVDYAGECGSSAVCENRVCFLIYDPICGSDGETYSNGCFLQVENCNRSCENQVKIVQKGECGTTPAPTKPKTDAGTKQNSNCENTLCPAIYDPVCGTDGKTYSNECSLKLENCRQNPNCSIKVAYKGECRSTVCENRACTKIYKPVCGSDNVTYGNGCFLELENCNRSCDDQIKIEQIGACGTIPLAVGLQTEPAISQRPDCEESACIDLFDPVCGTDGKTHSNACYLGRENCRKNPKCYIKVAYKGSCI